MTKLSVCACKCFRKSYVNQLYFVVHYSNDYKRHGMSPLRVSYTNLWMFDNYDYIYMLCLQHTFFLKENTAYCVYWKKELLYIYNNTIGSHYCLTIENTIQILYLNIIWFWKLLISPFYWSLHLLLNFTLHLQLHKMCSFKLYGTSSKIKHFNVSIYIWPWHVCILF